MADKTYKNWPSRAERDGILYREGKNAGLRRAAYLARQCPASASTPAIIKEAIAKAIECEVQE